ncbi:MAG: CHAT domain-containing tetratricopeptide repeat protein [Terracidiphilus sp.]
MNRATACALALCLAGASSLAQQVSSGGTQASPAPAAARPGIDKIAQCREALRKAEAEHQGNTVELADALDALVSSQIDAGLVDQATLAEVEREVQVAEAAAGPRSKTFVEALGVQVEVLTTLNRASEARPIAERLLDVAQKEFPDTDDASTAADDLGLVCYTLGDFPCALHAYELSLATTRKISGNNSADLVSPLNNLGSLKFSMKDFEGSIAANEEALALAYRLTPHDDHIGILENNLGADYIRVQKFDKALEHLNRAVGLLESVYGPDSPLYMEIHDNLANMYSRTGQFSEAWKAYEFSLTNKYEPVGRRAETVAMFARSLAQGGNPTRAVEQGLSSARISREMFVLEARTLPERQALAYDATRPHGLDTSISVVLKHPELPTGEIYQEIVRSRALVADEMARRQKNLNANNDPETGRLLKALDDARNELLAAENSHSDKTSREDSVSAAASRMEKIERSLAEHSAALRSDERIYQATTEDVRRNLPAHSLLISYALYRRRVVDRLDPTNTDTLSYVAFVLHPDSDQIHVIPLGDAAPIDELVRKARAAADAEAHSGGLGSARNERSYRQATLALRQRIWDPFRKEIANAHLALVVADGNLNLIPFASLPQGNGYLVEHGPVIHTLSSERDLVPADQVQRKRGLLAMGSPTFELAGNKFLPSPLRGATPTCEEFSKIEFQPLPGAAVEVSDIGSSWKRWNSAEPSQLVTGDNATLARFLSDSARSRVLHVATHAFLLDKDCGGGNPLLHSGLVFAGGSHGAAQSILTAQQIASLDLRGLDWAVLSACNTGNGELRDGEGVLGLQRAFRVAGALSVIMALWPVDDDATRQFMHDLYAERLGRHATTADAVWNSSRELLLERRAAGKSTHPWYWAGFVGSGGWE